MTGIFYKKVRQIDGKNLPCHDNRNNDQACSL